MRLLPYTSRSAHHRQNHDPEHVSLSWLPGEVNLNSKRKPATRLWAYHEYGSVVDQHDKLASVHQWIIFRFVGHPYVGIISGWPVIQEQSAKRIEQGTAYSVAPCKDRVNAMLRTRATGGPIVL